MTPPWSRVLVLVVGSACGLNAQSTEVQDPRPTIAVMTFSGGAMVRPSDYAGLGQGIREVMATVLASNTAIRVVERARLQAILDEQQVSSSAAIDPATAVRLGRVLGANHFIIGGYLVDTKERVRLDVRSVNVETSEIEYRQTVEGSASKLFDAIDRLARETNAGLRLPSARNAFATMAGGGRGDQARATQQLGRAIDALQRADTSTARTAARQALTSVPEFPAAKALLATIEPQGGR